MTKLLEQAIAQAKKLPEARQDEAARVLLDVVSQDPDDIHLSEAQLRDLARRLADPHDRFASDQEVAAAYQRMGV
ncbi:MAG: hypothetical protein ACPGO3_00115 [Magnetospiraceae bacterium]